MIQRFCNKLRKQNFKYVLTITFIGFIGLIFCAMSPRKCSESTLLETSNKSSKKVIDMPEEYQVIIVGGGPTGVALAIELGLNNIKTLVLEKYEAPLTSPRAQSLSSRTMEFMMRWQIADKLKKSQLLSADFPMQGVWCSKLNGKTYSTSSHFNTEEDPQDTTEQSLRIPLWITEDVLRSRLKELKSVELLKQHDVIAVIPEKETVNVISINKQTKKEHCYKATYVVGCDGANSITRKQLDIDFEELAPKRRMINVLFEAPELDEKVTVDKGFLYYLLENRVPGAVGIVDPQNSLWYAAIFYGDTFQNIDEVDVDGLIEEITGIEFNKVIVNAHFWDMQIKLSKHFSAADNHVFFVGDSAHAFAPTGGFGLNTGFGDVVNLGWKLANVIQKKAPPSLLNTYEQERRPICIRNLEAAEENAKDAGEVKKKFLPEKDPDMFAKENAKIAKKHMQSKGITMGYAYFDSPLTLLQKDQNLDPMPQSVYTPTYKPGYFLPNFAVDNQSIYQKLSPIHWTLLICGKAEKIDIEDIDDLKVLTLPENTLPHSYVLLRPDWHITYVGEKLSVSDLKSYLDPF